MSLNSVKDKAGRDEFRERNRDQKREEREEKENQEFTRENFETALEEVWAVGAYEKAGVNISIEGQGPGLKVLLKDGSGALVKQLSGQEFINLKQSILDETENRGKILDHKV